MYLLVSLILFGVFHGVTSRNVCELLYQIHKNNFKFIGLDLFEKNNENKDEIIPNTKFSNPLNSEIARHVANKEEIIDKPCL